MIVRPLRWAGLSFDWRSAEGSLHAILGVDLNGLGPYLALKLVGECGTNLSAWPSAKHFTSWLALAPHNKVFGKSAVVENPAHRQSGCGTVTACRHDCWAYRNCAGCVLSPFVGARREGKGRHCHSTQDCRPVLQYPPPRHPLRRSRRVLLRRPLPRTRPTQPPKARQIDGIRPTAS
jgi:hypothetical protein